MTTLQNLGVDPGAVWGALPPDGVAPGVPLRQLLVNANREAQVLGHYQVDSIHLLLALLYSDSPATSSALQKSGLTMYDLRRHMQTGARPNAPVAGPRPTGVRPPDSALRRRPLPRLRGVIGVSPIFLLIVAVVAASGALLWVGVIPNGVGVLTLVFVAAGWIATVCIHEFCHALVAYIGGDRSVASAGYLRLDPLRYTNFLMSIVFPAVFLIIRGIALPGGAVYINRGALRNRWWDAAVSLAGPIGTLTCGIVIAAVFVVSYLVGLVRPDNAPFFEALSVLGFFEMYAFVLNLLPVPPLDGFGIIRPWLPYSIQSAAAQIGTYGIILVFGAIWFVPGINMFFNHVASTLAAIAGINPDFALIGLQNFSLALPWNAS